MIHWLTKRTWPVLQRTWQRWRDDDCTLLSAAMAYYAAFSLFPLCLVLISGLGYVMKFSSQVQDEQRELLKAVRDNLGDWLASELGTLLNGVQTQAGLGGPIGMGVLLLAAIGVFMQFDNTFDRIWKTESSASKGWLAAIRSALYDRIVAFAMLLGVGALLVLVFVSDMVLAGVRHYVVHLPGGRFAWHSTQIVIALVSNSLLLGTIYRVLPKAPVRWREALAGGFLVAIVWQIGQQILVAFLIGKSYTAYGIVGSFIAVMLWLYYVSSVVFFGAEFVRALGERRPKDK
jgi:membrane protein